MVNEEDFLWKVSIHDDKSECISLPANIHSFGLWEKIAYKEKGMMIWEYSLPMVEIYMVLIFLLWQFFYFFFKKIGLKVPKFTAQIIAGIALAHLSVLKTSPLIYNVFFPEDYKKVAIGTFGAFGFLMFWFIMGVKTDVSLLIRSGKRSIIVGMSSTLLPTTITSLVFKAKILKGLLSPEDSPQYSLIIILQSLTSFPVICTLLTDLKFQNSELGRLAISSSMISESIFMIISIMTSFLLDRQESKVKAWMHLGGLVVFMILVVFVVRKAMLWAIKRTPEDRPVKTIYIYGVILVLFASTIYWDKLNQVSPFGAFILGLAVPDGPPLGSAVVQKFELFVSGILMPFFVAICSMRYDLQWFLDGMPKRKKEDPFYDTMLVIMLLNATKFVGGVVPALAFRMPIKDCVALALIMSYKGVVELGFYFFDLERGALSGGTFSVIILFMVLNSFFVPILVKRLYDPSSKFKCYKRKNLMNLKSGAELRIVACIHRPNDITSMINFLEAFCASKKNPLVCYVLHLMELIGQVNPIFVSHQKQTRRVGHYSCSENVIVSFSQFQREFLSFVNVNTFTSVSSRKRMHEDVCLMAINKATPLIVLPFHRTWSVDGSAVTSENEMIRRVNNSIIEKAPCSVALLVDRSRLGRKKIGDCGTSPYQVCMVFLGGKDDREALRIAKRMSYDSRLCLTVVRFIAADDDGSLDWERMLDSAELEDVKLNNIGGEYVIYCQEVVEDGTGTASVLQSMTEEHDLFVVGRGGAEETTLTRGLKDWNEYTELGMIGDLLASPELHSRASVLVVQQKENVD